MHSLPYFHTYVPYNIDIENLDIDILEDYVSNPINAFGIIKRTHKESLKKLNLESSNSIINLQKANRSLMEFINDAPAVEDFYAATESIALIQVRKYVQFLFTLQKKKVFGQLKTKRNASKFAMFMEKENPWSFFRF